VQRSPFPDFRPTRPLFQYAGPYLVVPPFSIGTGPLPRATSVRTLSPSSGSSETCRAPDRCGSSSAQEPEPSTPGAPGTIRVRAATATSRHSAGPIWALVPIVLLVTFALIAVLFEVDDEDPAAAEAIERATRHPEVRGRP